MKSTIVVLNQRSNIIDAFLGKHSAGLESLRANRGFALIAHIVIHSLCGDRELALAALTVVVPISAH
ncbi:hypothetical protein [Azospirillum picis]|uniref:Uncharacterized protein n=1 Tax=Azospirillum picis TaxID=488438 RepID=A0ABU0MET5_9PROT|nr:hypothetical protein [Azospirillum picis]MBP2297926.1 hypothetical protein [Azospirillum picis]MDQ0531764.1 hypothetical protein [Azospirillum picis]